MPQSRTCRTACLNTSNFVDQYQQVLDQLTDNERPRAYLNYLVFDERMNLIEGQSGAIQIGASDAWHTLETINDIEIAQGGYLTVYLSNESMSKVVYFDNLHVKYYKGVLQEENHYYPFGMCLRISQATVDANNVLYQTKELNQTENMNLYDFAARQYDPLLGRFTSIDPMLQFASGYVGMGNNPVLGVDPTGMVVDLSTQEYRMDYDTRITVNNKLKLLKEQDAFMKALNYELEKIRTKSFFFEIAQQEIEFEQRSKDFIANSEANDIRMVYRNAGVMLGQGETPMITNTYITVHKTTAIWENGQVIGTYGKELKYHSGYNVKKEYTSSFSKMIRHIAWNSDFVRNVIPDKVSFSIGAELMGSLGGFGVQPFSITVLTRGKATGMYMTPSTNYKIGGGLAADAGLTITTGNYTGDPDEITPNMLVGESDGGFISGGLLGEFGFGLSYAPVDDYEGFNEGSFSIGFGGGFAAGYQNSTTLTQGLLFKF